LAKVLNEDFMECRHQELPESQLHSPICLHGVKRDNFTFYCKSQIEKKKFQTKRSKEEGCNGGYKVYIGDNCNQ